MLTSLRSRFVRSSGTAAAIRTGSDSPSSPAAPSSWAVRLRRRSFRGKVVCRQLGGDRSRSEDAAMTKVETSPGSAQRGRLSLLLRSRDCHFARAAIVTRAQCCNRLALRGSVACRSADESSSLSTIPDFLMPRYTLTRQSTVMRGVSGVRELSQPSESASWCDVEAWRKHPPGMAPCQPLYNVRVSRTNPTRGDCKASLPSQCHETPTKSYLQSRGGATRERDERVAARSPAGQSECCAA